MTDSLPAYVPDKDELKQRLSLHYACVKLGIQLDREDRALCPFHADQDPSFYLWDGDDGVTRWWCQPCGVGGDVFDLIQGVEHVTFTQSVVRAAELLAELPPGYEPPARPAAIRLRPTDWTREVDEARVRAARPDHAGVLSLRVGLVDQHADTVELAQRWDVYLRGTWGLGISETGSVYVPHWSPDGTLTGCKVRRVGKHKDSLPGSRYEHLYGSWLGRRHRAVFLTEGESDAWYAGWSAAAEGVPLDVLSLPSGANQPVPVTWLDFLRGASPVYLAFDPDEHGVDATRRWITALGDAGFREVRVCCLPFGRDLRDARPSMRTLLNAARKPLREPDDVQVAPGGYLRTDRNGNLREVTTWSIEPVAQLAGGDDPGFDAVLHSRGVSRRTVIRLADLASTQSLNKWANRHEEIFVGTDADRQRIAQLVKAQGAVTPEVFQTERVGMHDPPAQYHFAGPTCVFPEDYIGKLPFRYAPTSRSANLTGRVLLPTTETFKWRWLEAFVKLSSPDVTHPLLAWLVASARRTEVREFPLLFVGGSSGVGKSTLARLAIRLLGSDIEVDLGANTPFILYRTLASTASLPVFVDEWTRLSRQDTREAFQGIVPLLYTGGEAERGMADLGSMSYRVSAPTIVAGEDTFTLDRELERTVCIYPTRDAQNVRALAYVQAEPLQAFGQVLHHWLTELPSVPDFPSTAQNTRNDHNRQVLLTGWATLLALLDDAARHGADPPDLPREPDLSALDVDPEEVSENVYLTALIEASAMTDPGGIPVCWADSEGRGTWVRFPALLGLIDQRRLDVQLPGRSRAMRAYFQERYGKVIEGRVQPPLGTKYVRAYLIPGLTVGEREEET